MPPYLKQYWKHFAEINGTHFTKTTANNVEHEILTTGWPCLAKTRRVRPDLLEKFEVEIQQMLDLGIIRPSNSQWWSPMQLVIKKDGSLRTCGDYRRLNLQTLKDEYPIPNIL